MIGHHLMTSMRTKRNRADMEGPAARGRGESSPVTVILTTGPFPLLCALALLQERGESASGAHVVHYGHSNSLILDCESWLSSISDAVFIGSVEDPTLEAANMLGSSSLVRLLNSPRFAGSWRTWARKRLLVNPSMISEVILPFRPHLTDAILLSLFPSARVRYVPDGFLVGFPTSLRLPFVWRLRGVRNPYSGRLRNIIWVPEWLEEALAPFGHTHVIAETTFKTIVEKIVHSCDFASWKKVMPIPGGSVRRSCLLLQVFSLFNGMDPFEEVSFYAQIINHELEAYSDYLIVKPHPRDNTAKLSLLKLLIPEDKRSRVHIMQPSRFSVIPVELMLDVFGIDALVGCCSTALLYSRNMHDVSVRLYSAGTLPEHVRREIRRLASIGDFVIYDL